MKRIIKITLLILIIILLSITIYVNQLGPNLTAETLASIEEVLDKELPEIIKGKTGYAQNGGISIWYESLLPQDSSRGSILLNMGIANDALAWPDYFMERLLQAGYQVIRYDHRGTGLSDWMDDWGSEQPYSLKDMAADGMAVLQELDIEQAHIIGVSMGGMIAQEMAIHFPDRVKSLSILSSSGYIEDPTLKPISMDLMKQFIGLFFKYGLIPTEKNQIKFHLSARHLLMGDSVVSLDEKAIATQVLYNIRKRKGYNHSVSKQHGAAVSLSGSRYEALRNISVPTLVVHGKSDPLIPFEHGVKCAEKIPDAETLWLEGMGHDIPEEYAAEVAQAVIQLMESSLVFRQ